MAGTPTPEGTFPLTTPEKIYTEVRTGIRETDSISFRLIGLVPLVSGSALIGLILDENTLPSRLVIVLAVFAATITLGLFRWELRNVQTCSWLITYADALEAHALAARGIAGVFRPRPKPPQRIGKTEAEKLIYTTTIVAWLALPLAMDALSQPFYGDVYWVAAGAIFIGTVASLFATARVPPIPSLPSTRLVPPTTDVDVGT